MDAIQNEENWAGAPMHLLDLILEKVGVTKDGLQFGAVCKAWHGVFKDNQRRFKDRPQIPMLLLPHRRELGAWRAYDISADKYLTSNARVSHNKRFCGSSLGWLAEVNADWSMTLRNPFSTLASSVHLPPIFPPDYVYEDIMLDGRLMVAEQHDYHVSKALITADPMEDPDECFAVVIFSNMYEIAFIKVSSRRLWTRIPDSATTKDIVNLGNQLYSINFFNDVHSFDLENPGDLTRRLVASFNDLPMISLTRYLVHSHDKKKVYVIMRHYKCEGTVLVKTALKFEIFELNRDDGTLKRVTSIKDSVVFVGENSSICSSVSNISGCQRNCIYFTRDLESLVYYPEVNEFNVYHVPTDTFRFHRVLDVGPIWRLTRFRPTWIVPTFDMY